VRNTQPTLREAELLHVLSAEGVVAVPAEAVWGLSCDPWSWHAVSELLALKQRPVNKGLILVGSDMQQFSKLLSPLSERERQTLGLSWPGANTWLVPNQGIYPPWVTGGHEEVAIRVTSAPALARLCNHWGGPLVSTSANPAGAQPANLRSQVVRYFGTSIPTAAGSIQRSGRPSVIRRMETGEVLRA